MARKDIHPKVQDVTYVMLDGSEMIIPSAYTRSKKVTLEIDIFSHQAWKADGNYVNDKIGQVAKFKEKFGMAGKNTSDLMSMKIEQKSPEPTDDKADTGVKPTKKTSE